MSVFFGFSDVDLANLILAKGVGKSVVYLGWGKGYLYWKSFFVGSHGGD